MNAWVLHTIGDLRFEDLPIPVLMPGEALVRVQCAGICSSDISRIFTVGAYSYPLVPGHEFSGVVEEVRDGEHASWLGRRVGVFPLIPCFKCPSCLKGLYETCANYDYIGSRRNGAFARYVVVPVWNLIALPDAMDFETAAMLEPVAVALHAVKMLDFENVADAAVLGTGPIGRLIARWLEIYGVGKVSLIGREGRPADSIVDACFEAVGDVDALRNCMEALRPGGQLVLVGNPDAEFNIGRNPYWKILRKQLTIHGSWNSRFPGDWNEAMEIVQRGELYPSDLLTHRYALPELGRALEMIRNGSERRCKVMIDCS
jgi:L-iditol 2-dehydrogenase